MKIQCTIEREGGTPVRIGNTDYHFTPGPDGKHVAEVEDQGHIARFLAISEAYCIHGYEPRAEHKPVAVPVESESEAPVSAAVARASRFPESFVIGGRTITLGNVIDAAIAFNGLNPDQWADLTDDEQADKIDAQLDLMADEAEALEAQAAAVVPDPADTNGDGVVDDKEERAALVAQHVAKFGSKPHHKWSIAKIRAALEVE